MLRQPEGREHIGGDGGFHRRHRLLHPGVFSHATGPVEVSDSRPVSRQPAELFHRGTNTHTHTQMPVEADCHVSLSSQAGSYQEVGKVTGEGLIKGHAYAITDTVKVSVAHGGLRRPPYRDTAELQRS